MLPQLSDAQLASDQNEVNKALLDFIPVMVRLAEKNPAQALGFMRVISAKARARLETFREVMEDAHERS